MDFSNSQLSLEERVTRLEMLLSRSVGINNLSSPWLGGWDVDEDSIFSKGASTATVVDLISSHPRVDVKDAAAGTTISQDYFTDTDGVSLGAHTPDTGNTWIDLRYGTINYYEIQSNEATLTSWSATEYAGVNTGLESEYTLQVDLKVPQSGTDSPSSHVTFLLRYVDDSNLVTMEVSPLATSGYEIELRYADGDNITRHFDTGVSYGTISWNYAAWNTIKVVSNADNTFEVYVNDTWYVTTSALPWGLGNIYQGFYHGLSSSVGWTAGMWRLDNWSVISGQDNTLRARLGKTGTSPTEYGLRLWDSSGVLFLNEEGLVSSTAASWAISGTVITLGSNGTEIVANITVPSAVTMIINGTLACLGG